MRIVICMPSLSAKPTESAQCAQVSTALRSGAVVDLQRLAIAQGRAAWLLYLDLYVLDADGALYDAALLAALAALASLKLPHVAVDEAGKVGPKGASATDLQYCGCTCFAVWRCQEQFAFAS